MQRIFRFEVWGTNKVGRYCITKKEMIIQEGICANLSVRHTPVIIVCLGWTTGNRNAGKSIPSGRSLKKLMGRYRS